MENSESEKAVPEETVGLHFKRDRIYKFILRGARKQMKKRFFNSEFGKNVYRISDDELF